MSAEYVHVSMWNMNGGSVPQGSVDAVVEAVEAAIKSAEEKHNVRLLYSVITNDPVEV